MDGYVPFVRQLRRKKHPEPLYHLPDEATTVGTDEKGVLRTAVHGRSALPKISDGCRRPVPSVPFPKLKAPTSAVPWRQLWLRPQHYKRLASKSWSLLPKTAPITDTI